MKPEEIVVGEVYEMVVRPTKRRISKLLEPPQFGIQVPCVVYNTIHKGNKLGCEYLQTRKTFAILAKRRIDAPSDPNPNETQERTDAK